VLNLGPIQRAIGFPKLDGVIGYNMLRRFRVRVDMDDAQLTFSSAALPVPKTAVTVPFTLSGGIVRVKAAVDGVGGTFMIDTGDRSSLTLFRHFAETNNYSDVLRTSVSLFGTTIPGVVTRASRDRGGGLCSRRRRREHWHRAAKAFQHCLRLSELDDLRVGEPLFPRRGPVLAAYLRQRRFTS
jgi:hypothetical protein